MKFKAYILLCVLFATILVSSTTAIAEKSKNDHDQTAGEEVKETNEGVGDTKGPERFGLHCRFGCCIRDRFGCRRCCRTAGEEVKEKNEGVVGDAKEPEGFGSHCRFGCCIRGKFGCIRCCKTESEYKERKSAAASGDGNN